MSVDIRPTPPAQDSARQNVTLQIVSVVMFTFIGYLTIGIPLAVLPGYVHDDLGYGSVLAGLVISLQYLATLLARPYAGRVIDGSGRSARCSTAWPAAPRAGCSCCSRWRSRAGRR